MHGRLTPRVWRRSSITVALKVRLWKSFVLSKCLYALEVRVVSRADLHFLERKQIRKLRHLARSPVHLSQESNETRRSRVGSRRLRASFESCLLLSSRLLRLPSSPVAALSGESRGQLSFEQPSERLTTRQQQLLDDASSSVACAEKFPT